MAAKTIELPFLAVTQHGKTFYLVNMAAKTLSDVSYAAVRGRDKEEGAVQRVLNARRISGVKEFAQSGGVFPNSIVMNWIDKKSLKIDPKKHLQFEVKERSAQLIDGQHRVAGIREAMREEKSLEDYELPVAIYVGLSTKECADIFLSINTEQKPVHRSLVFDLYAVADENIIDPPAARARDIAVEINDVGGPYEGMIKFPGEKPRKGGVALSTVVTSIKPLIEANGVFDQVGLETFENQTAVISNFFNALKKKYGDLWFDRQNAFMFASGFAAAIEFLGSRIVPFCVTSKSFSVKTISDSIDMEGRSLLLQKEITGKSGGEAQKAVFDRLDECFVSGEKADEYEF
jgi:DNA sulfur modification protein DndB